MNFYKKMRNKTTLSPSEVVEKMKEVAPSLNSNLDVKKYLQCEKGYRKMKGERLDSFLQVINNAKNNPMEKTIDSLNLDQWFEDFRLNHFKEKMEEFGITSQKELAEKLGVGQSTVSRALRGISYDSNIKLKLKKFFSDDLNIVVDDNQTGYVSSEEYEELKNAFIEKAKESGKNYVELGIMLGLSDTTVGKIIKGKYECKGNKVIQKMKDFINGEFINIETKETPKKKYNYSKYANIISKYKEENNLTMRQLSEMMGVCAGTMSQLLNLKYSNMNEDMLNKLKAFCESIKPNIEEITNETIVEEQTDNIEETTNEVSDENATKEENIETPSEEEHTSETKEKPFVYEFNLTGTKEFDEICKKYNKLLKKYNRQQEILKNYETLINVIKTLQK